MRCLRGWRRLALPKMKTRKRRALQADAVVRQEEQIATRESIGTRTVAGSPCRWRASTPSWTRGRAGKLPQQLGERLDDRPSALEDLVRTEVAAQFAEASVPVVVLDDTD